VCAFCAGKIEVTVIRRCAQCGQAPKRGRPRGSGRRLTPERDGLVIAAFQAGQTLEAIGHTHGVTRERTRQILKRLLSADERVAIRTARYAARAARREQDRVKPYLEHAVPCTMCRQIIVASRRGGACPWLRKYPTCSPRCAKAFLAARQYVSAELHENHRLAMAKTCLQKPEKYGATKVRWAIRVLAGTAQRRILVTNPQSHAKQVAREFGFLNEEAK